MIKRLATTLLALFMACFLAFAQKSFEIRYQEAMSFYEAREYDKAIKMLEAAKKVPGATRQQIDQANKLIKQCRAKVDKTSSRVFKLSKKEISFPAASASETLTITTEETWQVLSLPSWCEVARQHNVLIVTVHDNTTDKIRRGVLELSVKGLDSQFVVITQKRGPVKVSAKQDTDAVVKPQLKSLSAIKYLVPSPVGRMAERRVYAVPIDDVDESAVNESPAPGFFESRFVIAGGDWFLPFAAPAAFNTTGTQNGGILKDYRYAQTATVFLGKVNVLPGLSINAVQAAFYDINGQVTLQALSTLTGFDFRVGGGISRILDADLLLSGTYYIPWNRIFKGLSGCVSGFDCFFGAEVSSALPYANVNVKAGAKSMLGGSVFGNLVDFTPATMSFANGLSFVVSLGVTFGYGNSSRSAQLKLF